MRSFALLAAMLALSACATNYVPPAERAPPLWSGEAGFRAKTGTPFVFAEGPQSVGAVLFRMEIAPVRTARVAQEIRYRGAFGGEEIIPAGTTLIPQQFSLMTQTTYGYMPSGPMVNQNAANDPIEWCTVGLPEDNVCMFWEGADRVRYIPVAAAGVIIIPTVPHGMPGPMPAIVEDDAGIIGPIYREFVVQSFNPYAVVLQVRLSHNGATRNESLETIPLQPGGTVSAGIEGQGVTFMRSAIADGAGDSVSASSISIGLLWPQS